MFWSKTLIPHACERVKRCILIDIEIFIEQARLQLQQFAEVFIRCAKDLLDYLKCPFKMKRHVPDLDIWAGTCKTHYLPLQSIDRSIICFILLHKWFIYLCWRCLPVLTVLSSIEWLSRSETNLKIQTVNFFYWRVIVSLCTIVCQQCYTLLDNERGNCSLGFWSIRFTCKSNFNDLFLSVLHCMS